MKSLTLLLTLCLVSVFTADAWATTVVLRYRVNLDDGANNFGEDYWTASGLTSRELRGVVYEVYNASRTTRLSSGRADANGALSLAPGTYDIKVRSTFKPCTPSSSKNTELRVRKNGSSAYYALWMNNVTVSGSTTYVDYYTTSRDFDRIYTIGAIAAYSLWRRCGGMHKVYDVYYVPETQSCGSNVPSGYTYDDNRIHISERCYHRKTLVAHELGHRMMWHRMNSRGFTGNLPNNSTFSGNIDASCINSNAYVDTSLEFASTAVKEGWANFYAAAIWNSNATDDCWVRGIGLTYDCEGSDTYATNYRDNVCFPGHFFYADTSTILDWTRQFWDVYTNGAGVTLSGTMMDWIEEAYLDAGSGGWGTSNAYSVFDSAANTLGGTLNTNWDNLKFYNGVDN